jgi:hypothetical protein
MPLLHVYSRAGCHLCEILIEQLLPLVRGRATIEVRDVDTREEWAVSYGLRVPVVEHDGRMICQYELDKVAIEALLAGGGA